MTTFTHAEIAAEIDRLLAAETRRFLDEVPSARHLMDTSAPLDDAYYVRHRIETVRRIRLTSRTDAVALARMVDEDYDAARFWSRYVAEELGHDRLYLKDLARHGYSVEQVMAIPPFPSTVAMLDYLAVEIERVGAMAAVAYSVLVEWNSERFSAGTVARAEAAYSAEHVEGSRIHCSIDEEEDHYSEVVGVALRLIRRRGEADTFMRLLCEIAELLRRYFRELHDATIGSTNRAAPAAALR
jgi:heme oxygenase-like protein